MLSKPKIDIRFTTIWGIWVLLVLVVEFGWKKMACGCCPGLFGRQWVGWLICIVYFVVFEFIAIRREQKGDTLSAQVWRFLFDRPARIPVVVGFTALICVRLYEFGRDQWSVRFDLAQWLFVVGLFLTLIFHFVYLGRKG